MKKFLFTIVSALFCCMVQAQDAQALLERFVDRMVKDKGITMTASGAIEGTHRAQSVNFSLSGKRFRFESDDLKIWFDGKTQWQATLSDDEICDIYISEPSEYGMILDAAKKHDGFKLDGDGKSSFTLTSDNPDGFHGISSVKVSLDPKTLDPITAVVISRQWTVNVTIKNFKSGQDLPDSHFRCNATEFPDAEIIDLR